MKVKAQRQIDTDTSREKVNRVVDRPLNAIKAFHLETSERLNPFRNVFIFEH